jgi:endoglucanase
MNIKKLLVDVCSLMSISGYERYSTDKLFALIGDKFDECYTDNIGNHIFVKKCGREGAPKILIDCHYDEIGMMVSSIKEGGFISVEPVGGVDARLLQSSEVTIYGKEEIYGVFASTPPHLMKPGAADKLTPIRDLIIDTGYTKEELEEIVSLGTPVGYRPVYTELLNDHVAGKAFDDKACGACAIFGIDAVQKKDLAGDVYFLFSALEETGLIGARVAGFGIRPDYALVLDVTHAETPDTKDRGLPPFGSGIAVAASPLLNRRLVGMVTDLCRSGNIPFTVDACPGSTGTNANVLGICGDGIPTALCSLPLKSMHTSCEALSMDDANALKKVVSAFIKSKEIAEVFGK